MVDISLVEINQNADPCGGIEGVSRGSGFMNSNDGQVKINNKDHTDL